MNKINLYHPRILEIEKLPFHFEKQEDDPLFIANNPFCGDRFKIFDPSGNFTSLAFYGHGCAVSKASTSLFVELVEKYSRKEMVKMAKDFLDYISENEFKCPIEELEIFNQVRNFPARKECALLPWKAFLKFEE